MAVYKVKTFTWPSESSKICREKNFRYSEWKDDLEKVFEGLLQDSKRVCDDYLKSISDGVLKYFFGKYKEHVQPHIKEFRDKSAERLKSKHEELQEVGQEIEDLEAESAYRTTVIEHMEELQKNLKTAHEKFIESLDSSV